MGGLATSIKRSLIIQGLFLVIVKTPVIIIETFIVVILEIPSVIRQARNSFVEILNTALICNVYLLSAFLKIQLF